MKFYYLRKLSNLLFDFLTLPIYIWILSCSSTPLISIYFCLILIFQQFFALFIVLRSLPYIIYIISVCISSAHQKVYAFLCQCNCKGQFRSCSILEGNSTIISLTVSSNCSFMHSFRICHFNGFIFPQKAKTTASHYTG